MGIREDDSLAFALQAVAGATLSTQVLVVITTISSILSLLKVTENMVHPGGFEPPTARFVAEYSIQLSYGCIGKIYFTADIDIATKAISSKRWCIREDYSPCGSLFSVEILRRTPLTRRRVCRCSVSVVAHYRELFRPDKRKI